MVIESVKHRAKQKEFFNRIDKRPSFQDLSKQWKPGKVRQKLLPDTKIFPSEWTYLVSKEKRPHTILLEDFKKKELKDGDKVYFERGQIYNFTELDVTVNNITFGAYGSGADPKFYGSTSFSGATWTSEAGGYYSTPLATAPLWVFNPAGEAARQGESDWIPVTANPGGADRTFLAATLNAFNSIEALTTAKARFKEFNFRMSFEYTISSYNTGTGTVTFGATVGGAAVGYPMKLYGQKQFATLEGDWWYDDANDKLWIKSASDPSGLDWRVCTQNNAFYLNAATGTTITGIELTQYYESAIKTFRASTTTISVDIHDIRNDGLFLQGNCTGITYTGDIARCGMNGIYSGAISNSTFSNWTATDIGKQLNIGWPIHTSIAKTGGCAFAVFNESTETDELPDNIQILDFTAGELGYMGVNFLGTNNLAERCHIYNHHQKFDDGGGLYTFYRADLLGAGTSGTIFRDCIVHGGVGSHEGIANYTQRSFVSGVYLDAGTNDTEIDGCTLFDHPWCGVFSNYNTEQTYVHDCTITDNDFAGILFYEQPDATNSPLFANNYKNDVESNIFITNVGAASIIAASDGPSRNVNYNPYSTGFANNNTYFVLNQVHTSTSVPTALNMMARFESSTTSFMVSSSAAAFTNFTLASWATRNSQDGTSTSAGFYLDSSSPSNATPAVWVEYNATGSTATKTFPTGVYNDLSGAALNSADVPAWSAAVGVIKSTYYYLMDNFLATSGTSMAGRAPKIGSTPTVAAGTHTINAGGDMVSSVAGIVIWNLGVDDYQFEMLAYVTNVSSGMRCDFRMDDNLGAANHRLILDFSGGNIRLREYSAPAGPQNTWTAAFTLAANTTYRIRVVCSGSTINVYVGGVLYLTQTTVLTTGSYVDIFGDTLRGTNMVVAYPV